MSDYVFFFNQTCLQITFCIIFEMQCYVQYMVLWYLAPQQVSPYPIVHITVSEHGVEVLYTLKCLEVISVLKTLPNCAQVHRICYYCIIILKDNKDNCINEQTSVLPNLQLMELNKTWQNALLQRNWHQERKLMIENLNMVTDRLWGSKCSIYEIYATYWEAKCYCINRLVKGPRKLMPP